MAEYEKKVRNKLLEYGCTFQRHGKGDHVPQPSRKGEGSPLDIWHSPITGKNVTVDGKIPSRHTANAVMKQAGINYHF
ncbi:addiction module toxin, HicA family protein [Spirochaetia bacterium]|nr:addiction module toxin, HicA family protein [Spirochaetia bacterium]